MEVGDGLLLVPHVIGDGEQDDENPCVVDMVQDEADCHFDIGGEA